MRNHVLKIAAAAAMAVAAMGPAVATEASVGRVQVADLDLNTAVGREALTRRAHAVAARVCGLSPARGAADHAALTTCREEFVHAVHAAADLRTGAGANR